MELMISEDMLTGANSGVSTAWKPSCTYLFWSRLDYSWLFIIELPQSVMLAISGVSLTKSLLIFTVEAYIDLNDYTIYAMAVPTCSLLAFSSLNMADDFSKAILTLDIAVIHSCMTPVILTKSSII